MQRRNALIETTLGQEEISRAHDAYTRNVLPVVSLNMRTSFRCFSRLTSYFFIFLLLHLQNFIQLGVLMAKNQ